MLDKYKTARVQRMVPWRGGAISRLMIAQRQTEEVAHAAAARFQRDVVNHWARTLLQSIAADHAFESGAMLGEVLPKELRTDWG